jgi:hypothetical protein
MNTTIQALTLTTVALSNSDNSALTSNDIILVISVVLGSAIVGGLLGWLATRI